MTSLEILDLGRNQLRILPADIAKLTSLKVLSVPKNHIRELPLCLADMGSLQVLKFEGNPISFPPKDAFQVQASSPPNEGRDSEVTEVAVTSHIKKFLKQYAVSGRADSEAGTGDESSEVEAPTRFPLKRAASGRFPIRVNGSDVSEMRSPVIGQRAPPIPNRSHYRGLSQQSTSIRRPGVMPLTIGGNVNERIRSNSETLARPDRPENRNRRMGIVPKKTSDLGTLNEMEANNRFSHYRGFSMGSALQSPPGSAKSPATPSEPFLQRPIYVRRLSVLPERKRDNVFFDPVVEAAKGILYSVFQIHPMIQMLMTLTEDPSSERSSLEPVFYNTNFHVEQLEQEIQKYDAAGHDDYGSLAKENQGVHSACQTLVGAYSHVCALLADNIDTMVSNGDARYIRSLLMLLYNSVMELRATLASVTAQTAPATVSHEEMGKNSNTIKAYQRDDSGIISGSEGPQVPQIRNDTGLTYNNGIPKAHGEVGSSPGGPRRVPPPLIQTRSGDLQQPFHRPTPSDPSLADSRFERIFSSLHKSTNIVLETMPNFCVQLSGGLRNAVAQRAPENMLREWKSLISMCNETIQRTEMLKTRLNAIQSDGAGLKVQPGFWGTCSNFVLSWTRTLERIKDAIKTIPLPPDTRGRLRPLHQTVKETSNLIMQSPWQQLFQPGGPGNLTTSSSGFDSIMMSPTQTPITPQSAALGPALQATVPKTPQSASFDRAFQGNVFDRADALIANPGMAMSRSGTMSRGHSNLSSMSSISSMSSDGAPTPSTNFSPSGEFITAPFPTGKGGL